MIQGQDLRNVVFGLSDASLIACREDGPLSRFIDRNVGDVVLKNINGRACRSLVEFYEQLSLALGFPEYFGYNLSALSDCMSDELPRDGKPLVLRISHADHWLASESAETVHGFLSTFIFIGSAWAKGVKEGQSWDAPPRRFLVVLEYV